MLLLPVSKTGFRMGNQSILACVSVHARSLPTVSQIISRLSMVTFKKQRKFNDKTIEKKQAL